MNDLEREVQRRIEERLGARVEHWALSSPPFGGDEGWEISIVGRRCKASRSLSRMAILAAGSTNEAIERFLAVVDRTIEDFDKLATPAPVFRIGLRSPRRLQKRSA